MSLREAISRKKESKNEEEMKVLSIEAEERKKERKIPTGNEV